MFHASNADKERMYKLAEGIGVELPDSLSVILWPLPILEELVRRLSELEKGGKSED